ncbi:MAG: hypothetical protein PVG81_08680, partial [Desulfobacterales bacterium]
RFLADSCTLQLAVIILNTVCVSRQFGISLSADNRLADILAGGKEGTPQPAPIPPIGIRIRAS